MNSKVVFGQYYNSGSWIHRLDPRTKIIGVFFLIVSLFLLNHWISLAVTLGLILILILSTKIPLAKFIASLRAMSMLLFITVIIQVVFTQGESISLPFQINFVNSFIALLLLIFFFESRHLIRSSRFFLFLLVFFLIFYLQYSVRIRFAFAYDYSIPFHYDGLLNSVIIVIRIVSLIFISSLLTLTTTPTDLNIGLESLMKPLKLIGVKVSILTMMISIALRFIPTLINEANKILKAQASRGVDFKEGRFRDKITQIISLLVPMFIISYRRATDLADAMEARGYIPEAKRTTINLLKYRFADIISISILVIILAGVIAIRVTGYVPV
jgi:energy-coupling factor transport system permease protein